MTEEEAKCDVQEAGDSLQNMHLANDSTDSYTDPDQAKKAEKQKKYHTTFLYVNQTFAPSPDQIVKNLYDCYSTENKLVLHYCKTQAWG
ncbi:hypothetical protein NQ314_006078 [Rhamnusium bicolor]|uniref:Ubiquitin-like protein ATG12 n=1 Tax=Rhamnusium bicolor TaxID=1586634 RepID=A0AAV8Z806_9CUCU|nr:hypothetical protein NQ314_006078 [Rhamnusium bicolor]